MTDSRAMGARVNTGPEMPHTPLHAADRQTADPRIPGTGASDGVSGHMARGCGGQFPMQSAPSMRPETPYPALRRTAYTKRIVRPDLRRMPRIRKD